MKPFFAIALSIIVYSSYAQAKYGLQALNPTGTYNLNLVYKIKKGDRYGYFGSIKVRPIKDSSFAMSFFICKGAPSYNLGSFTDTVIYKRNNVVTYTPLEFDSTCVLTLKFTSKGVTVYQQAANINFACGFGHGVAANDLFFKKVSSKKPVIKDPLTD